MPSLTPLLAELQALVANTEADVAKAETGNKAASTRVRKTMQAIKVKAQEMRKASLPAK